MMALYEMITVHRRAANYKLINNRISDTEYKFEQIFLHVIKSDWKLPVLCIHEKMKRDRNREEEKNQTICHERVLKQKCWAT